MPSIAGNTRISISNRIYRAFKRLYKTVLDGDQKAGQSVILIISDRAFNYMLNNNIEVRND